MSGPVVDTHWNVDIFVDVEWGGEPLGKYVDDVVVGVGAVVKIGPKGGLPFLRLDGMMSVRSVKDETLKLQFSDTRDGRTNFERGIRKIADTVGAFEKSNLWVEVGADLPVFRRQVEPVGAEVQSRAEIGLSAGFTRRARLSRVSVQHEILEENKSAVRARSLIET